MISVLILCRNYEQYLPEAIASVEKQTFKDFELKILHDSCGKPFTKDHPIGEAAMRNKAIRESSGDYILFLDADDFIEPQALAEMDKLKAEDTIVASWAQFFGQSQYVHKQDKFTVRDFLIENRVTMTSLLPRKVWEAVGGFDEKCKYLPDWEFWIRVAARGFKFQVIPQTLLHYRIHENNLSKRTQNIDYIKQKHRAKYNLFL